MILTAKNLFKKILPDGMYNRVSSSSVAKRIIKGSLWSIFGSASSRVLNLVGMILLARILGKTSFGEFGMIQATLVTASMMAGLGLGSTVSRYVAHYKISDPTRAGRVIALIFRTSWLIIFLVVPGILFASDLISSDFLKAPQLQTPLQLGTILVAFRLIWGVQTGILTGLERFDIVAKLNLLDCVVTLTGFALFTGVMGVTGAILGMVVGSFVVCLVGWAVTSRCLSELKISISSVGVWQEKKLLTSYGLPNFLAIIVSTPILWFCMGLLANRTDGYDDLALYQAAYQWHGPLIFIPMALVSVSAPILVQEWEGGSKSRFRKIFFVNTSFLLIISFVPVFLLSLMSASIMGLYGSDFTEGWLTLVFLLAAVPFHAMEKMASSALLGINKPWLSLGVSSLWGVSMITFSLLLISDHGALGLAIAFFASYVVSGIGAFLLAVMLTNKPSCTDTYRG